MINYDSFSRCHLTTFFFAFHAGAKEIRGNIGHVLSTADFRVRTKFS